MLPEWQLAWFADHGERLELAPGERLFGRGQPADFMFVVVSGSIERYEEIGGQSLVVATTRRGEVTGMLPYSRMTHYPGDGVAPEPTRVLRVEQRSIREILLVSQEIGRRLVGVMSDRVRGDVRLQQQRERMMALGRLSAGLAHELNNPASAVRRAAEGLLEHLATQSTFAIDLVRHHAGAASLDAAHALRQLAAEREPDQLSPLERSEREEALQDWLEDQGLADAWEIAGTLADAGLHSADLETFADQIPQDILGAAVGWVGCGLATDRRVAEITSSATRISELIASVKTYSHMDRSSEHKLTDVRKGLDNTLTMLSHKLSDKGVKLVRDYQEDLPQIPANAGELNQIWTNLIDNAVDAMADGGDLLIEAKREDTWVAVRIVDDGPGIPEEAQPHIFEPFFTTKGVGEGTGLGLDIARRIAKTHRGHIEVRSSPGRTEMCVRLPVAPSSPPVASTAKPPDGRE